MRWSQPVCLKYMPRVEILQNPTSDPVLACFRRHFVQLRHIYGRVVSINLIDKVQKGKSSKAGSYTKDQNTLGVAFGKNMDKLNDAAGLRYVRVI